MPFFPSFISVCSKPSLLYPTGGDKALVPVTLKWQSGSLGQACSSTGSAATFLYLESFSNKREELTNLVAVLAADDNTWEVPYQTGSYRWMLKIFNGESNTTSNIESYGFVL